MDAHHLAKIDWNSNQDLFLINPRLDMVAQSQVSRLRDAAMKKNLQSHFWIQSSGSSQRAGDSAKWMALSKKAFLTAAGGANEHLQVSRQDRWGLVLPLFHVGGLAILGRSDLSGCEALHWSEDWNPHAFFAWLKQERISLLSLVPTQLFDLVQLGKSAPPNLRAVVLGGARLEPDLYKEARALGWPVLPSFGMTECCSQIATATFESLTQPQAEGVPDLKILPHITAQHDSMNRLWIKSESLFTGYLQERSGQIHWQASVLENGFWCTPDRAEVCERVLIPKGREGEYIKIKGEGVNLSNLRARFESWMRQKFPALRPEGFALAALPDPREGHRLIVAFESGGTFGVQLDRDCRDIAEEWNEACFPIERLVATELERIPRSALNKVLWGELEEILSDLHR